MPVFKTTDLCNTLESDVKQTLNRLEELSRLNSSNLSRSPSEGKWSILQVLEHLNSYNRYYLSETEKALQKGRSKGISTNASFSPGWFGNYFTNMMQPKEEPVKNAMKAPKDHTPIVKLDSHKVIREFIEGQNRLIDFLQQARHTDIGKLKVPISISRLIKLKLGDTFRFLIAHQQRHFIQIENVVKALPATEPQPAT